MLGVSEMEDCTASQCNDLAYLTSTLLSDSDVVTVNLKIIDASTIKQSMHLTIVVGKELMVLYGPIR